MLKFKFAKRSGFSEESMWHGDWLGQDGGQWNDV